MTQKNILVTGASGQVGQVLYHHLVAHHGAEHVIATDIKSLPEFSHFEYLDITDQEKIAALLKKYQIGEIYHLAAILSANAEKNPIQSWDVNMTGLLNILKASVEHSVDKVFFPSSIAVFGNHANLELTSQFDVQHPTTLYGVSKSAGENWCQYFHEKYALDVRSLRYPGIIGATTLPGGGTTDYAVHIYHEALKSGTYDCYVKPTATMPMIYMDDALRATIELMSAPADALSVRTSYNLQGLSFSPEEIAASIQSHIPNFQITYSPDFRQAIADNWPKVIDDQMARQDWNWQPHFDLESMTNEMLRILSQQYTNV